jgi:FkbM family methyltransferase
MEAGSVNAEIYDQGAELDLLAALVPHLEDRSAVDVGSERGALAAALRESGFAPMWLVEPYPGSAAALRDRFGSDPDVHVLEVAAGAQDDTAALHLAEDGSGMEIDAYHSLDPGPGSNELQWKRSLPVEVRSLDSLAAAGEIPQHVGLLKVDAEGSDADVLRGAASLDAGVVMVEYWNDLPDSVGPCPYTAEEVRALVAPLGPSRFLFVRHGRRHVSIGRWDVADVAAGEWGNLVLVADSLVGAAEAALPAIDRVLRERNERTTSEFEQAAAERLELIEELTQTDSARSAR